ncbi:MAG: hypothetical protein WEB31_06665 [Chthoniobacterales bacterium]
MVAILFAAPLCAQEQEQRMMDRIMNPKVEEANPMGAKAFSSTSFSLKKFEGSGEYRGVKPARTKEYTTRKFLGIRNPWFGRKVYETGAARELTKYVLSDKEFASRTVDPKSAPEEGREALQFDGEVDTRQFLGRGKSQASLSQAYGQGSAPLSLDDVRELLNRNR